MVRQEPPPPGLTRPEITTAQQHKIVARPGQADMTPDIERMVHRVAHAERVLDGGELVRGETGAQLSRNTPQEAGGEGVAGTAGRRRQPFGNL